MAHPYVKARWTESKQQRRDAVRERRIAATGQVAGEQAVGDGTLFPTRICILQSTVASQEKAAAPYGENLASAGFSLQGGKS